MNKFEEAYSGTAAPLNARGNKRLRDDTVPSLCSGDESDDGRDVLASDELFSDSHVRYAACSVETCCDGDACAGTTDNFAPPEAKRPCVRTVRC